MPTAADVTETSKLDQLASAWGLSVPQLIDLCALDDVAPGICMNPGCTYSTEVEPDQSAGWCEDCETRSVRSALILAGVI